MLQLEKLLGRARRLVDDKPVAAHIYVTEKCNLRCAYCTERDNRVPQPSLDDLRRWIDKLAALGVLRIGIQGGEPLLHPQLERVVRHIKDHGLGCSMASNGLLLTAERAQQLDEAGLDALHISVDRMQPTAETVKCVERIRDKAPLLRRMDCDVHITSVLYGGSLDELPAVLAFAEDNGFSAKAHLIHSGRDGEFGAAPGERDRLAGFIDWEKAQKRRGRKLRATFNILDYQRRSLYDREPEWTCLAGYKYLFVSARGAFWLCSMRKDPGIPILEVTPALLRSYNRKKRCQAGCGVYCVVGESLANNHPLRFAAREAAGLTAGAPARLAAAAGGR